MGFRKREDPDKSKKNAYDEEREVQWDSLVSNMINIWIIEQESSGGSEKKTWIKSLTRFIQDDTCRLDACVLCGSYEAAFTIARRLGAPAMQDVYAIRSAVMKEIESDVSTGVDKKYEPLLKQSNAHINYTQGLAK